MLARLCAAFRTQPDGSMKILSVDLHEALAGNPVDNIVIQPTRPFAGAPQSDRVDPPTVFIKGESRQTGALSPHYEHAVEDFGSRSRGN